MPSYLMDTHVLLWSLTEPEKIRPKTRKIIEDRSNEMVVSIVSLWEIAIKKSIGKILDYPDELSEIVKDQYTLLNIEYKHVLCVRHLPMHHRDPFDRMLVAQAQQNKLNLITSDTKIAAYDVKIISA